MKNFNITRIKCDLSWPDVRKKNFQIQQLLEKKHQSRFDNDYDYLCNINLDFSYLLDLPKITTNFTTCDNRKNYIESNRLPVNDEKLMFLREHLGFIDFKGSVQGLLPGTLTMAHYDGAQEEINEESRKKSIAGFYAYLEDNCADFSKISIDKFFNIAVVFLEPWYHGQAFIIGRSCFTNWKKGDVISFPWYMQHCTVNASLENRHILFSIGSIE